jgi:hypothetical protein
MYFNNCYLYMYYNRPKYTEYVTILVRMLLASNLLYDVRGGLRILHIVLLCIRITYPKISDTGYLSCTSDVLNT